MPAHILVIDDNEANLELMAYLLNAAGHRISTASDGDSGLARARAERPDLIVCDAQMPGLNGYEVARQARQDPLLRDIPLISVTAYAMAGDREKSLAAGFDGYLSKPITPETFSQQIGAFLRGSPPAPRDEADDSRR